VKEWRNEKVRIRRVMLKCFVLMLQYLTDESLEALQRQIDGALLSRTSISKNYGSSLKSPTRL
jgi:hypothetical protein